jgi:glycosyltransferase involved in cell wall biosynthesis
MPQFSLIVATVGRTREFSDLLQSLSEQEMHDFELIVVDQNSDDRLYSVLQDWAAQVGQQQTGRECKFQVKHLRCAPGLSRARNLGLANSSGAIIAFPDDDCWYPAGILLFVDGWFKQHETYGILSLGSRDETGRISGNRWPEKECDLTRVNAFRTSATYTYFVRRPAPKIPLLFDEAIGPGAGTPFGAGEDTDFLLTLMSYGIRGRFYSARYIGHPYKPYADTDRARKYGGGFGRVLAKHSLPVLWLALVTFDFTRAAIRLPLGDRKRASTLWAHGWGMIQAYFSK